MGRKRIWVLGGASLGIAFLFLWGTFRGGTAADVVPEPVRDISSSAPVAEDEAEGAAQRYDGASSLRDRPLRDPFRLAAPAVPDTPLPVPPVPAAVPSVSEVSPVKSPPVRPILRGTMVLGADRRAVIEFGGQTVTVKEGEQVGTWQVTAISQKKVVVTGEAGDEVLSLS